MLIGYNTTSVPYYPLSRDTQRTQRRSEHSSPWLIEVEVWWKGPFKYILTDKSSIYVKERTRFSSNKWEVILLHRKITFSVRPNERCNFLRLRVRVLRREHNGITFNPESLGFVYDCETNNNNGTHHFKKLRVCP